MDSVIVRPGVPEDLPELAEMSHCLWPDADVEEHAREREPLLAGKFPGTLPGIVLVAHEPGGPLLGFVEVDLRSHADGCDPARPVGFIEGWYVSPTGRRRKIGAQLIAAAEDWARNQGCKEMGSDTWLDHLESQRAHEALGFEVVDRCVHYRKLL
jgi:aminoglycoside 6'-N-acetyltransferase I